MNGYKTYLNLLMNNNLMINLYFNKLIKIKNFFKFLRLIIKVINSLIWGYIGLILTILVFGNLSLINYIEIFIVVFILSFFIKLKLSFKKIHLKDFLIFLELKYPFKSNSAFELNKSNSHNVLPLWEQEIKTEINNIKSIELKNTISNIGVLLFPLIFMLFLSLFNINIIYQPAIILKEELHYIFQKKAYIEVLKGFEKDPTKKMVFHLSKNSKTSINLMSENLLSITLIAPKTLKDKLSVFLYDKNLYYTNNKANSAQNFKLMLQNETIGYKLAQYNLTLSINKSSYLIIPFISKIPIAEFVVNKPNVPEVNLIWKNMSKEELWFDNVDLQLQIQAYAYNNLKTIYLEINTDNKKYKELVANIIAPDMQTFNQDYTLSLEKYIEEDIMEVEVRAVVSDMSVPMPLLGYSTPIKITVASAYGRYKKSLHKLAEIKDILDTLSQTQNSNFDDNLISLMEEVKKLSLESPFFDAIDRNNINKFQLDLNSLKQKYEISNVITLRDEISNFLFEHEAIDDRERDRDFFVALRSFSNFIKIKYKDKPEEVVAANDKIIKFVKQRMQRWDLRVNRLDKKFQPKEWTNIKKNKIFEKSLKHIKNKLQNKATAQELAQVFSDISSLSVKYKNWIEKLEQAEDANREALERKRQESLVSIAKDLKNLQRTQDEISSKLDNAQKRSKQIEDEWPSIRMQQNSNIQNSKSLESKIRAFVPQGYSRLKMAISSMETTVNYGNKKEFLISESAADTAARLLRDTSKDVHQKQKESIRNRARKRTIGDKYYGGQIIGGDVNIFYQHKVDKKYREEILDDILNEMYNADKMLLRDDKNLLENYLYEIIR